MDVLIFLWFLILVVGAVFAWNYISRAGAKLRTNVGQTVDSVRDSVRGRAAKIRSKIYEHRGKIAAVAAGTVLTGGVLVFSLRFSVLETLPNVIAPAAVEVEATVASPWSAASTGTRISSGIALTAAAARGEADGATWQTWTTLPGTKQTVPAMQPNVPYQFTLALTPGEVRLAGAQRTIASAAAQQTVRNTLLTQQGVILQAVLLVDPDRLSLQAGEAALKPLSIDVPRLLSDRQTLQIPTTSIDAVIERAYGSVSYGVQAGATQGWVQASVLLMANNRGLDQIITTQCIGECTGPPPDGRVPGSPRLIALLQQADAADISLFLTDLGWGWVHGVLVSKTPVNGRSMWKWSTSYPTDKALANVVETAFKDKYNDIDSRDELLRKGEQLSRLVFAGSDEGKEASRAFDQLVQESAQWQLGDGLSPKSLFFHIDFVGREGLPMMLPIGLMTVTLAGGVRDFAGHHLMIEQPMLKQPSYGAPKQCTANWNVLMSETDDANDPLYLARNAMIKLNTTWPSPDRFTRYRTMGDFQQWVTSGKTLEPTIVTTLSHHADNNLFFVARRDEVPSSDVLREFGDSSIAILDGCGTGRPGAMDFVARFNSNGIHSAIVSAYDVNPAIAGAYLACLRQEVGRGTTSIASAHFRAVNTCTWSSEQQPATSSDADPPTLTPETYAANALKYVLLGNAATTICQ